MSIEKKIENLERELETLELFFNCEFNAIRKEKIKTELDKLYDIQIRKLAG